MMKKVIYLCTSKSRYFVSPIQPKTLNEREGASGIRELGRIARGEKRDRIL
jgi:hypothetical protein